MSGDIPAFPALSGTEQLHATIKARIAACAWEDAGGDENLFVRLCLQHVRGDIDLFADRPAETDATERVRALRVQEEMERAAGMPQPPATDPATVAEREPAITGPGGTDRTGRPVGSRPEPLREE